VPEGRWDQTDLPFPRLWTISTFFFPIPLPQEGPYAVPHTSSTQERGLSVHLRRLQHVSAFSSEQRKPMRRKPTQAGPGNQQELGLGTAGCMALHPLPPPVEMLSIWSTARRTRWEQDGPASNEKGFRCHLAKARTYHKAATKPLPQPLALSGGL